MIRSTLLDRHGFVHGFATRIGGVSQAPFATLNLGHGVGDDKAAVEENRVRFLKQLALSEDRFFTQRQVHGAVVRAVGQGDRSDEIGALEGDALIASAVDVGVGVRTADCVPVLVAHPGSGRAAAVHAGWRGAVAEVLPHTIAAMSVDPGELIVAIGPHIRVDSFEIGEEVATQIQAAAGDTTVLDRSRDRPHGDLAALLQAQLVRCGVPSPSVDDVGGCTHADPERFFSHRRDQGRTGRHLSVIVARDPSC